MNKTKIIVVGGGAAGFFAALAAKEINPNADVEILELSAKVLNKVRISGGGRCNVTHCCFDPKVLVNNYPRGNKALLSPFYQFQPQDTVNWFKERGVHLKVEADGRMFPVTDSSSTVIDCFLRETTKLGVKVNLRCKVQAVQKREEGFQIEVDKSKLFANSLIMATGSGEWGFKAAQNFGHSIQKPMPSLFTFNIPNFPLIELAGVSTRALLSLPKSTWKQEGPVLITHWGFSGPAALKLSAFAAKFLAEESYSTPLSVDWLPQFKEDQLRESLIHERTCHPTKTLVNLRHFPMPNSLWKTLCEKANLNIEIPLTEIGNKAIDKLIFTLKHDYYEIKGKTTNKEEFVTCGGITLSEVNFKTMESKRCKNLFFCGEILDIDGVTGGFNFQNAWTTGWIAGRAAGLAP